EEKRQHQSEYTGACSHHPTIDTANIRATEELDDFADPTRMSQMARPLLIHPLAQPRKLRDPFGRRRAVTVGFQRPSDPFPDFRDCITARKRDRNDKK